MNKQEAKDQADRATIKVKKITRIIIKSEKDWSKVLEEAKKAYEKEE